MDLDIRVGCRNLHRCIPGVTFVPNSETMALKKADKAVVYPSRKVAGQWGWRYVASNGRRVAIAGELYHNKSHAERMVNKLFPGVAVEVAPNKEPKKVAKKKVARSFKPGDLVVCYRRRTEAEGSPDDCGWVGGMNAHVGKVMVVTGHALTSGAVKANGWAWMNEWLRHATPAEVRKFNAQKGKA